MSFEKISVTGDSIKNKYGFSTLCSKLIEASGIDDSKIQELKEVSSLTTSQADCVKSCVDRILKAKSNHEKIFVGGDYDADGICSTAIMKYTLDKLGIINGYYIPDRLKEGYGLHSDTVTLAHEKGYSLIITVDNGVKCQKQISLAHDLGMDIIITDHHIIEEKVDADIVVHPDYMEERYSTLSGAGVALQISRHLIGDCPYLTVLACVAAIGDVMPLWKETRAIVFAGLQILKQGFPKSVFALLDDSNKVDTTSISYQIVPKLNAIARMDDNSNVNRLVNFLLETRDVAIAKYVSQINAINQSRKLLSRNMMTKAQTMMKQEKFVVLFDDSFKQGIVGIVAGRIANTYHKPALVFSANNDELVGSARSIEGFDIYDFFSDFENLVHFGGHSMAAGITIKKEFLGDFIEKVNKKMDDIDFQYSEVKDKAINVDSEEIVLNDLMEFESLEPLPKELEKLYFNITNLKEVNIQKWSKVTKYHFNNKSGGFDALAFSYKNLPFVDEPKNIIGTLHINRFRNMISPQVFIEEIE